MKKNKKSYQNLLLPFLIVSFLVMSGCKDKIEPSALMPGDTWCEGRNDLHDKGRYTTSMYSSNSAAEFDILYRVDVPCRWLASSSAPVPTQAYHVDKDRLDVTGTAYSGKAVGNTLEGLWLVIESRSTESDATKVADYSIAKRYTCELSLDATNQLTSVAACPLFGEIKSAITYEPSTQALLSEWPEVINADIPRKQYTLTYTMQAQFIEDGIYTGKLSNRITEWNQEYGDYLGESDYHPTYFQLVRIGDKGKTLGQVKLRDRAQALTNPAAPFTTTYPVTGFYEYQQGNVWQLRFENNGQTVLEASGQNAFDAIQGSLIELYDGRAGHYLWGLYNGSQARLLRIEGESDNTDNVYYGLYSKKYNTSTLSKRDWGSSYFPAEHVNGVLVYPFSATFGLGEEFYAAVGGIAPIQQKFASFPYGERSPWQWLLNGKKGINIEFYYHDEVVDDIFYVPVNTNIHYIPYTTVVPDKRASVRDIGGDLRYPVDVNGDPILPIIEADTLKNYTRITDADTMREASVEKLQQVVIDIAW